jgi:ATP-dependent DNA helicase RecG
LQRLGLRIDVTELKHPDGRVVIFRAPPRPIGAPIKVDNTYWMRAGESLVAMSPDHLRRIFDEAGPDYSAEICQGATLEHLALEAIAVFRERWADKTKNPAKLRQSAAQLLEDAGLLEDGQVTYAALVLLGTAKALGRFLACAEVIFEWRNRDGIIAYQQRKEYREGFLLFHDDLWNTIHLRNEIFQYQDGLFRRDVPVWREVVVREAVLNAVAHRDYRNQGSVFVRQWPTRLEIVSPGGFPNGITADNILLRQKARNRCLAEAMAHCGLVERSGQGADLMFELCLRDSKALPNYEKSDDYEVNLVFEGQVRDPQFIKFLERLAAEKQLSFGLEELLVLADIRNAQPIPSHLVAYRDQLLALGAIERAGRGKYVLAKAFFEFVGRKGEYTRTRGLDHETNKALLLKHIRDNVAAGSPFYELHQVLPNLTANQVRGLVRELARAGEIHVVGQTKAGRWFPGAEPEQTPKKRAN